MVGHLNMSQEDVGNVLECAPNRAKLASAPAITKVAKLMLHDLELTAEALAAEMQQQIVAEMRKRGAVA